MDDALNGFFCDFDVYVGTTGESPELLLGERVVLKLIQGHHHQLYMENVFTSFPLFATLLSRQICAVGTCEPTENTFRPSSRSIQDEARGVAFRQCGNLVVTAWQDKTITSQTWMLSVCVCVYACMCVCAATMCQLNATTMVKRRQKDGSSTMVPFP